MTKNKENKTAMMCWEALNDFLKKEPPVESKNEGEKPIGKMQKQNMKKSMSSLLKIQAAN